jgi:hypothetical protein
MQRRPVPVALALLAGFAGCAHGTPAAEEPGVLEVAEAERLDGRALVQMEPDADRYLAPGQPPGPFPDRATLVALAVGQAARDEAVKAFGALFRGGADVEAAGSAPRPRGYRVLVAPRAWSQVPGYREARSAGVARQVAVSLQVKVTLLDAAGKPVWERSWDSGTMEGPTYFPRGAGGERLGGAAQATVARLVRRAALETAAEARRPGGPTGN